MEYIPFEVVTVSEAKAVLEQANVAHTKEEHWEDLRRAQNLSDGRLNEATYKWVLTLPVEVWPLWLMKSFPRVANQFAETWQHQAACETLFLQLFVAQRAMHKGFSVEISREIMALKSFFQTSVTTSPHA